MKVLNFGSLNLDYVYQVESILIPGETQASKSRQIFCGGKGLNQSIALAKAGIPVYHAGLIGEGGEPLLEVCKENGVNTEFIRQIPGPCGHTVIQVDENGQNCILLFGGSNRSMTKEFVDTVLDSFEEGDIILLQNEINELDYIIDRAYEKHMMIILNKILTKVKALYPKAKVVLTLGGDGSVYQDETGIYRQGIFKVKAVDTTAAGDTFTGYFISSIIDGLPVQDGLELAAKASAIAVSRPGATASIPLRSEVVKEKSNGKI